MPHEIDPTSPLAVFADELRHARLAAGLTQEQLGAQLNYSEAQVGHIETGKRTPALRFAEGCDRLFKTNGYFARLRLRIEQMPSHPEWLGPWTKAEREALSLHHYEPLLIPGLLQKEAYAREILGGGRPCDTEEQVDELVAARLHRQQILTWDDPPALWFVLDEGILHRQIGEAQVMREQLEHLVALSEHPQVTIQIISLSYGARPGLLGALGIARFADRPDIVYLETATDGQIVNEPKHVAHVTYIYDAIRACAMPARQSVELIKKATAESWT